MITAQIAKQYQGKDPNEVETLLRDVSDQIENASFRMNRDQIDYDLTGVSNFARNELLRTLRLNGYGIEESGTIIKISWQNDV